MFVVISEMNVRKQSRLIEDGIERVEVVMNITVRPMAGNQNRRILPREMKPDGVFVCRAGMVMLSGIMAIFEMGLALTGQTLLPVPPDDYLSSQSMKDEDKHFLKAR